MVSPALSKLAVVVSLSSVRPGSWTAGTVTVSWLEFTGFAPYMADAVATLTTEPAVMSAWVTRCWAEQVMNSPGSSGFGNCGQLTVALLSLTA